MPVPGQKPGRGIACLGASASGCFAFAPGNVKSFWKEKRCSPTPGKATGGCSDGWSIPEFVRSNEPFGLAGGWYSGSTYRTLAGRFWFGVRESIC